MATILGQDKVLDTLTSYNVLTAPRTLLLLGEDGLTRAALVERYISNLHLDSVELSDGVSTEDILDYLRCPVRKVYRICLNNFTEKAQNQFLKFIEEPSESVYLILEADSEMSILPTILNRCFKLQMNSYSKEELKEYFGWLCSTDDERVFEVCKTPEQLQMLPVRAFSDLYGKCEKLVDTISSVSYDRLLKFTLWVNCKENTELCDLDIFFRIMCETSKKALLNGNANAFEIYRLTNEYSKRLALRSINKSNLLVSYLTELWEATR